MVAGRQPRDEVLEERVGLGGRHDIVADTPGHRLGEQRAVVQERRQVASASDVKVEVDAAVVVEQEIADRVGALDRVRVGRVGGEEPRVFGYEERDGCVVSP